MTVIQAIQCCNLDRSYGYQLFNGTRQPTGDILITPAIQVGLTEAEELLDELAVDHPAANV